MSVPKSRYRKLQSDIIRKLEFRVGNINGAQLENFTT